MNRSSWQYRYHLLICFLLLLCAFFQFYGIDRLVLGSDELYRARSLMGDDWSLTKLPWPTEAARELFEAWPIHTPPLFAILTRAAVVVFGENDFAMRFWPFLFAILGTAAIYCLYKKYYGRAFAVVALLLAGLFSDEMLINAKSLKHYTADILVGSLILIFTRRILRESRYRDWFMLILLAAVGVWLAFGTVFIAASAWAVLALNQLLPRWFGGRTQRFWPQLLIGGLCVLFSLILLYLVNMRYAFGNSIFLEHIANAGQQFFDWSKVLDIKYGAYFIARLAYQTYKLASFFFIDQDRVGLLLNFFIVVWFVVQIKSKNFIDLFLFMIPVLLSIACSFAGLYPYTANRLLLYLLPIWTVVITFGMQFSFEWLRNRRALLGVLFAVLLAVVILPGIGTNMKKVLRYKFAGGRHVHTLMRTLMDNAKDQDQVYLHYGAILPFYIYATDHQRGYQNTYPLAGDRGQIHVIYGEEHLLHFDQNEPHFRKVESTPGRLWVAFCHRWPEEDMLELKRRLILKKQLLTEYNFKGCQLLLFDDPSSVAR
ncbi:glycosyltransferase family 39 protein [bacterium]|nr:glycosyltransferase family 39 protein [bacterium]